MNGTLRGSALSRSLTRRPARFGVAGPAGAGLFAEDPEMEQGGTEKQRQNGLGQIIAANIEVHRNLGPVSAASWTQPLLPLVLCSSLFILPIRPPKHLGNDEPSGKGFRNWQCEHLERGALRGSRRPPAKSDAGQSPSSLTRL